MQPNSESSGDEASERKYWRYLKNYNQDHLTPFKMECASIKEEDELSNTDVNITALNNFSLNLDSNGLDSSNNSKSLENLQKVSGLRKHTDSAKQSFEEAQIRHSNPSIFKQYVEQKSVLHKPTIEIVGTKQSPGSKVTPKLNQYLGKGRPISSDNILYNLDNKTNK